MVSKERRFWLVYVGLVLFNLALMYMTATCFGESTSQPLSWTLAIIPGLAVYFGALFQGMQDHTPLTTDSKITVAQNAILYLTATEACMLACSVIIFLVKMFER